METAIIEMGTGMEMEMETGWGWGWGWQLSSNVLPQIEPMNTSLLLTEGPLCPRAIQRVTDEIVFETFGFNSCYRAPGMR